MTIRNRKTCPRCGSLGVSRRVRSRLYVCAQCDWTGSNPVIRSVECQDKSHTTGERIERLRQIHDVNPDWTKQDLVSFGIETKYMVDLYMHSRSVA